MYVCRLFRRDQPFEQVDARLLAEGALTLGRDPAAGWPLEDSEGMLSRFHCTLSVEDGALVLRDQSTNGTYLDDGSRVAAGEAVTLRPRQTLTIGSLTLFVDEAEAADAGLGTIIGAPPALPSDWVDAIRAPAPAPHRDQSLLEAFCEGARLDASALSGEDPVELMERLGAIYRQTIIGLATLIEQRTRMKGAHQLDRTTIGAADNNPFKWTPSRRLAQDLLSAHPHGYLSGVDAVRASFEDVIAHLAAVASGAEDAVAAVADHLSPDAIAAEADKRGFSLKSRAAACWEIHAQRHAALGAPGSGTGLAADAFRAGYARAGEAPTLA